MCIIFTQIFLDNLSNDGAVQSLVGSISLSVSICQVSGSRTNLTLPAGLDYELACSISVQTGVNGYRIQKSQLSRKPQFVPKRQKSSYSLCVLVKALWKGFIPTLSQCPTSALMRGNWEDWPSKIKDGIGRFSKMSQNYIFTKMSSPSGAKTVIVCDSQKCVTNFATSLIAIQENEDSRKTTSKLCETPAAFQINVNHFKPLSQSPTQSRQRK